MQLLLVLLVIVLIILLMMPQVRSAILPGFTTEVVRYDSHKYTIRYRYNSGTYVVEVVVSEGVKPVDFYLLDDMTRKAIAKSSFGYVKLNVKDTQPYLEPPFLVCVRISLPGGHLYPKYSDILSEETKPLCFKVS